MGVPERKVPLTARGGGSLSLENEPHQEIRIVTATLHRLRPLLIGVVVLLLTAGIALAGKPSTPPAGLAVATEASGKTVPAGASRDEDEAEAQDDEDDVATETVEDADADEEAGENCASDPSGLPVDALAALRHGSIVCWAAHQETPAGYDNHGQWVSEWAKKNHGHADGTVEDASTTVAAGRGHGQSGKGNAGKP